MKTNQLKTKTTRQPSILHPNKGFTHVVWYDVINRITGLTYTQKQFILFILDNLCAKTAFAQSRNFISAYDIVLEAQHIFREIQLAITHDTDNFHDRMKTVFRVNLDMIRSNSRQGIRIQKFVRHILGCMLTEREIRSICKTYIKRYPDKYNKCKDIKPFVLYVIKKMNVFGARLLRTIYTNGTQIVHIAEPKSYFETRREANNAYYINNFQGYSFPYQNNLIPYNTQALKDLIISYDTYMDRFLKYANLDFSSNIATKIISDSLLNDIISYMVNDIPIQLPKSITSNKDKIRSTHITLQKMVSYAECMRLMPASQQDDRHFTINSRGDMSYTPAKKPTYLNNSKNKWLAGQDRMVAKYGKGVKKLFQHYPENIPDFIIEQICNLLKSQHKFTGEFKVFTGDDIVHWYNYKQHHPIKQLGSLGNSCMKHESCQPYIKFYAENNDVVSMVAIIEDEKIVSRALLWKTVCGTNILDRIYGSDKYIAIMKQYAQDKGYIIKARQSYEDTQQWVTPIGETMNKKYTINVKYYKNRKLPYMDTFYAAKRNNDIVSNEDYMHMTLHNTNVPDSQSCRSTSGSLTRAMANYNDNVAVATDDEDEGMITCSCGNRYPEDEVGFCEHYQEYYHTDDLNWCDTDDCYYHTDVSYWVGDESFCTERDYDCHIYSEHIGDYIWLDDSHTIYNQDGNIVDYTNDTGCSQIGYCNRNEYFMYDSDIFYCDVSEQDLSREFVQRITLVDNDGNERRWMISDEFDIDAENNYENIDERLQEWLHDNNYTILH